MIDEDVKLKALGTRLRDIRLRRDETQAVFAARLGVSTPTLRKMEMGSPSVMIGSWSRALAIVDRSDDWDAILSEEDDLFARYERLTVRPKRQRASGRRS